MNEKGKNKHPRSTPHEQHTCPECRVGKMKEGHASLFTDIEGNLITLPDFPAWICDLCGHRAYDRAALSKLQALLSTEQSSSKPATRVQPQTESDPPSKGADTPRAV